MHYWLIIPPSTMEDEGRFRLATTEGFETYIAAEEARDKIVAGSKGWFQKGSILIVTEA